ncbi:DegT/DnrJ/EryC1/StrS family aminotransferase [Methyloraptor flagellatus]|uniref:DegT/DnrJ/EryC1/StrS family aminotransferase n=1 Tax=Methyloraptor flagellatus TaxID=3162530 RepID=A0AAU7XCV5_9HYPH
MVMGLSSQPAAVPLSSYLVATDAPFSAVLETALGNGLGEVLIVDLAGKLVGRANVENLRASVRDGRYTTATAADVASSTLVGRLEAEVDGSGTVTGVRVAPTGAFVPVAEPWLGTAEYRNVLDAFLSGWISSQGEYIRTFERRFADYCQTGHGVAVSNGTVAIHLALMALGIGPGDEVIVPDLTFAATINTVIMTGAKPVIVDVDPDTGCMSAETIRPAITAATRAVIPVHVFGRPAPMTEICELAREHRLYVIEDCAEAHGARYDGRPVGSFGDISTFSFFANKVITSGEGGICVTNSPFLADRMRVLRDHGMRPERRYWHEEVGYNYRMTNLQAAVVCAQLDRIDQILATRQRVQDLYVAAMSDIPGVRFLTKLPNRYMPVTWFACAAVPADKRAKLIDACRKANVDLRPYFHGLSMMPAYARWARPCPVSERLSLEGVNLPTSHLIDEMTVARIAGVFRETLAA